MSALQSLAAPVPEPVHAPSEYVDQMPKLREFAALSPADPRRRALRDDLILAFVPVVEHLARRHSGGTSASVEELTQVGMVALITAIDRWDPELARGEFLGYLIPCVRGEMLRWFRDRTWAMRVPRRLKDLSTAIGRVSGPLSQSLGRAPRPSELAARLDVGVEEIIEALQAKGGHHAGSLDALDPQTGIPVADRLGDLDGELEKVEYRHALRPLLDGLAERERTILMLRFFGEMSQTEIAQEVGISQMHVSRLLARTLSGLRAQLVNRASQS
ncbi:MAG: polymerase sigma-B factor [Pseudonocardiales bacterium]|nr:polymerase sigma-B factor [Pseudonocardiales bacterium]